MAKLPDSQVIKDLAELLNATGLTEIEIESGGMRIKVARSGGHATTAYVPAPPPVETPVAEPAEAPATEAAASSESALPKIRPPTPVPLNPPWSARPICRRSRVPRPLSKSATR